MKKTAAGTFYGELDAAKAKPGACNCMTLSVFFVVVFVVLEFGVSGFFKNLRSAPKLENASNSSGQAVSNFSKMDLGGGSFQLSISQGQLCSAMPVDLNCQISPDGIILSGKISSFLPRNASVVIRPKVLNDRVNFEIVKCAVGGVNMPKFFSSGMTRALNNALAKEVPALNQAIVQNVETQDGVMLISTKSK